MMKLETKKDEAMFVQNIYFHVKSKKYLIFLQLQPFISLPSHISMLAMLVKWQCCK